MTTERGDDPQILDGDRMTGEEIDQATEGLTGRERWRKAAWVAEERAFVLGWEARGRLWNRKNR